MLLCGPRACGYKRRDVTDLHQTLKFMKLITITKCNQFRSLKLKKRLEKAVGVIWCNSCQFAV